MCSCFLLVCNGARCCTNFFAFLCRVFLDPSVVCRSSRISPLLFCRLIRRELDGLQRLLDDHDKRLNVIPARIQPADECSTNNRGGQAMGLGGERLDGCLDGITMANLILLVAYSIVLLLGKRSRQSWTICRV